MLNAKIKTTKISSGGETGFLRKFGLAKISRYTVLTFACSILNFTLEWWQKSTESIIFSAIE